MTDLFADIIYFFSQNETLATSVAALVTVLVFLLSFGQWLIRRIVNFLRRKKNKIIVIPNDYAFFFYGKDGIRIDLFFTMISTNIDIVAKDVIIKLKTKGAIHKLKWDTFYSIYNSRGTASSTGKKGTGFGFMKFNLDSSTYSHPVYLKQQSPTLMNVIFSEVILDKQKELMSDVYEFTFEIISTEKRIYRSEKRYIEFSKPNIISLNKQRSAPFNPASDSANLVKVDILPSLSFKEKMVAIIKAAGEYVKNKFKKTRTKGKRR